MDAAGNFLVTWSSAGQDGSGAGVYGQRYRANGTRQGGEFRVNQTTAGNQERSMAALDADGDAVVVWTGPAADGSGGVWARRYGAAGAAAGGEVRVNSGGIVGSSAAVDMDRNGGYVVAWSQTVTGSSTNLAQAYDAGGAAIGGSFVVIDTRNPARLQVVTRPGGAFVILGSRDDGVLFGKEFIVV
jgi:hypothetical protein